jgi:hypothetical protein
VSQTEFYVAKALFLENLMVSVAMFADEWMILDTDRETFAEETADAVWTGLFP